MTDAYKAIEELGGLELESDYPYEATDGKCQFSKNKVKAEIVNSVNLTTDETKLAQWLVQNGPISVGINANAMQVNSREIFLSHKWSHFYLSDQ